MSSHRSIESRLASASVASFASFLTMVLQSLLMVPLLLTVWTPDVYGQWIVATTAYGLLTTIDIGLQNYVGNLLTMAGGESQRIRRHLGSGVLAACITAAGLAVVWLVLRFANMIPVPTTADPAQSALLLRMLGILLVYWILLGSIGGIAVRLYPAFGLLSRSLWLSLFQRVAMTVSLVGAAWLGAGLIGATLAWAAAGALVAAAILIDVRHRFPECWPWWRGGSWRGAVRLIGGSIGMIAISLLDTVALAVLVALTDRWATAAGVALFAALRTAANAILQGSAVILTPVGPDLSRFAAARDSDRSSALIAASWLIATGPIAFAVTSALPITEAVFAQWTRHSLPFSPELFVALIGAVLVRQWASPLAMLLFCTNNMRPQFWISLSRCAVSIAIGAALFPMAGISAMGLAVLAGEVVAAICAVAMTPFAFPGLCDQRCQWSGGLALLQAGMAVATLLAWWWMPFMAWPAWAMSLVAQAVAIAAQWRNLHSSARDRIASMTLASLRRITLGQPAEAGVSFGRHPAPPIRQSES